MILDEPKTQDGFYDQENESVIVDFANKRLGGGYFGYGFVQEEVMFLEHYDYSLIAAKQGAMDESKGTELTFSM